MARSNHTRTLQHFSAMQLILSMQEPGGPDGLYPNILYVATHDEVARMTPHTTIHRGLSLMHDMLTLVDPVVYKAFHDALNSNMQVGNVTLNTANAEASVHIAMAFLQRITADTKTEMWEDPPHPCTFIAREVVAELLA